VLQCVVVCCSVLQCVAVCCSVLQCVAVCCSVLQCVVVCCSVLHGHSGHSNDTHVNQIFIPRVPAHVCYGVATISRFLKIIGLFCRI